MKLFTHKPAWSLRLLFLGCVLLVCFNKLYLSNKTAVEVVPLDCADSRALMHAAILGHKKEVEALLKQGLSVNTKDQQGNTALIYAAKNGHKDLVAYLIQNGADIH